MAYIQSQERVQLAQIGAQRHATTTQGRSNVLGTIASVATAAFAIFSDSRKKKDITWSGIEVRKLPQNLGVEELNTYSYRYRGDWSGGDWAGYMAQDLERIGSPSVSRSGRYLTVNYDTV
jgi:hypothetical protein